VLVYFTEPRRGRLTAAAGGDAGRHRERADYARVPSYIGATNVDIGSRVRKGDLLARIEVPEPDRKTAASNVATATLNSAEANLRIDILVSTHSWGYAPRTDRPAGRTAGARGVVTA
jgi:multidrug efflux pump subunit AcrA (membrane-fusion protein)